MERVTLVYKLNGLDASAKSRDKLVKSLYDVGCLDVKTTKEENGYTLHAIFPKVSNFDFGS